MTLNIIQLLVDAAPASVRCQDNYGCMPLHHLCMNNKVDDAAALEILKVLIIRNSLKILKKKLQREGVFKVMREKRHHEKPSEKKLRKSIEARKRKYQIDWSKSAISKPKELGVQVLKQMSLKELVPFIDWSPFFRSWDLHGKYPDILTDSIRVNYDAISNIRIQNDFHVFLRKHNFLPR